MEVTREGYAIFSHGKIGTMHVTNRLVRSATWDPSVVFARCMNHQTLERYRALAEGGVATIITGDFPVVPEGMLRREPPAGAPFSYEGARIERLADLPEMVHRVAPGCKIVAQLSRGAPGPGPSNVPSPFGADPFKPLSLDEIAATVELFAQGAMAMKSAGFDGVQLHAAHGGLLSRFVSPYSNRRQDQYGGSLQNRVRIIREIVRDARTRVGSFPILIKVNGTDYLEGGIDMHSFPALAKALEDCGVDAIEISGGMWDCLVRGEEELGFRPVPAPASHTRISRPADQSYFLGYAEVLDLDIPVILTGGNRDIEILEKFLQQAKIGFIGMCRPFLSEPRLASRWLRGEGESGTDCISCNSCLYWMYAHPGSSHPVDPRCLFKNDRIQHRLAQTWLTTWVEENRVLPLP